MSAGIAMVIVAVVNVTWLVFTIRTDRRVDRLLKARALAAERASQCVSGSDAK